MKFAILLKWTKEKSKTIFIFLKVRYQKKQPFLRYWYWLLLTVLVLMSVTQDREILKEGHRETKKRKFTFMYRDRWALNESMISRSLWEKGLSSSGRLVWNTAMTFKNYTQLWWLHQQTTGWNQFCQRFNIIFCKQKKNSFVFLVSHD